MTIAKNDKKMDFFIVFDKIIQKTGGKNMIWGALLVAILSGIIIIVFRCMDFPENEYSEMELATEREIKQERKEKFLKLFNMDTEKEPEDEVDENSYEPRPQFEDDILQIVEEEEGGEMATYMRSGLEIRIYDETGSHPIAVEEIPGGKSIIHIGRSELEDNDILIKNRMVSKKQYDLFFDVDGFGKEQVYLQAVKDKNPIRVANNNWQEVQVLDVMDKYCLSNEKINRFIINRMGVKMEIVNEVCDAIC